MWKSVPNAIRSTPASRKLPHRVEVLIRSIRNTESGTTNKKRENRLRLIQSQPIFLIKRKKDVRYEIIEYRRTGSTGRHYDAPQRCVFGGGAQTGRRDRSENAALQASGEKRGAETYAHRARRV